MLQNVVVHYRHMNSSVPTDTSERIDLYAFECHESGSLTSLESAFDCMTSKSGVHSLLIVKRSLNLRSMSDNNESSGLAAYYFDVESYHPELSAEFPITTPVVVMGNIGTGTVVSAAQHGLAISSACVGVCCLAAMPCGQHCT